MCPHCGEDVRLGNGNLTAVHDDQFTLGAMCPGSGQNARNAESDARTLWNGEPNQRSEGYKSWAAQQADIINETGA